MSTRKTISQINEKLKKGKAVVFTAEEVSELSKHKSPKEIAASVDVVTCATFGPMCSSGAFINFGHADPPLRLEEVTLNDVPVYAGIAAVDAYIGATSEAPNNPKYGGAHIIESLIKGEDVELQAKAKGTDCYPNKSVKTFINKDVVNEFYLFNPRNAYQNYAVAVNSDNKTKYTYMGNLLPNLGNANYSTSGELSPLLNDPDMRTIGIGTRIFICGAQGYVSWYGTQFNTSKEKNAFRVPIGHSATLALIGDAKQMKPEFIKAAYFEGYGVTIYIGIGIPIPVLNEEIAEGVSIRNSQIETNIIDYGKQEHPVLGRTNYEQLQSGKIKLFGKEIKTAPLSSLSNAREIADRLKYDLCKGTFLLSKPVQHFPKNTKTKPLNQQQ